MVNRRRIRIIRGLLLAGIAVCLIRIGQAYLLSADHKAKQASLREMIEDTPDESGRDPGTVDAAAESVSPAHAESKNCPQAGGEPAVMDKYAALYEENRDLAGWLRIEGTEIDYPVMQHRGAAEDADVIQYESDVQNEGGAWCGGDVQNRDDAQAEESEYYLNHDFYGEKSRYGCLYVKGKADIEKGTNFIIYGHNMKDGSMFGSLDLYEAESFYREHPVIFFDTLFEERTYEIIAVFPSQVYPEQEDTFKYYQFYQADTKEEFYDFYKNIKALSLYDTGADAEYGDTFLTLSTCAYHTEDGRFVVIARKSHAQDGV